MTPTQRHAQQGSPYVRRDRPPRAFTLVELLVVIGIVALLISILMPALSAARERASRTKCLANLRTLGQAMVMYASDSRSWLPNANPKGDTNNYDGTNAVLTALNRDYIRSPAVFHCPSDDDPVPAEIDTADYVKPNSARISYDFYSVWWMPEHGPKVTRIKDAPIAWDLDGGRPLIRRQNHGRGGGNVVFNDGHAEWQPRDQWDDGNWPHPAKIHYPQEAPAPPVN